MPPTKRPRDEQESGHRSACGSPQAERGVRLTPRKQGGERDHNSSHETSFTPLLSAKRASVDGRLSGSGPASRSRSMSFAGPGVYLEQIKRTQVALENVERVFQETVEALEMKRDSDRMPLLEARQEAALNIPGFWAKAICGHPKIMQSLTQLDVCVLSHISELQVEVESSSSRKVGEEAPAESFKVSFSQSNPFFADSQVHVKCPIEPTASRQSSLDNEPHNQAKTASSNTHTPKRESKSTASPVSVRAWLPGTKPATELGPFVSWLLDETRSDSYPQTYSAAFDWYTTLLDQVWADPHYYYLMCTLHVGRSRRRSSLAASSMHGSNIKSGGSGSPSKERELTRVDSSSDIAALASNKENRLRN